jgi:hypothetical protein
VSEQAWPTPHERLADTEGISRIALGPHATIDMQTRRRFFGEDLELPAV